jgi:hypothetical protein
MSATLKIIHTLMVLSSEPEKSLVAETESETTGRSCPLRIITSSTMIDLEGKFQAMMRPSPIPANSISFVMVMEQTKLEGP